MICSSGFASSFWTDDYASGMKIFFSKLLQGLQENQQILIMARLRADAEDAYSQQLFTIGPATDRFTDGFQRDDGASIRKAYEGIRDEILQAAKNHQKIASSIRELVVQPFSQWCDEHAARIHQSHDEIQAVLKDYEKHTKICEKCRTAYFTKYRFMEDMDEDTDDPDNCKQSVKANRKSTGSLGRILPALKSTDQDDPNEQDDLEIGGKFYTPGQLKVLLSLMLEKIPMSEFKVSILGTYQNVSTGADIVEYIQSNLTTTKSLEDAERIGQDLIGNGLLRLIGSVGNTFANSSRMHYQWRPLAFKLAGLSNNSKSLDGRRNDSESTMSGDTTVGVVQEYFSGWNPLNNSHPNESPWKRIQREAMEADEKYRTSVRLLDNVRCKLEETIIRHLKFMERCELDRLKAIKSVLLDFSCVISNVIPGLQQSVDNMMLYQETVQPLGDLRYLVENYRTGQFFPKVPIYKNYYNKTQDTTFGVDLEIRAKVERKRVPVIITSILTFLDQRYPDLEGDEARRGVWIVDTELSETHKLRNEINESKEGVSFDLLEKYEIPVVCSVLKLYMIELPDSIVSSRFYPVFKNIYGGEKKWTEEHRIKAIQTTLGKLNVAYIAALDAIMTHFTRLIYLTSADEEYISTLASNLAPCILRAKQQTSLTMTERYNYRLVRDIFQFKDRIFEELKRYATQGGAQANPGSGSVTIKRRPHVTGSSRSRHSVQGGINRNNV